jgi:hypothetical protein
VPASLIAAQSIASRVGLIAAISVADHRATCIAAKLISRGRANAATILMDNTSQVIGRVLTGHLAPGLTVGCQVAACEQRVARRGERNVGRGFDHELSDEGAAVVRILEA